MSSVTFPSYSYNTPHGHQFGREAASFTEETGLNPELWDDALDQMYEQTPATYDESLVEAREAAHAAVQASRVEAQAYARPIEHEYSREQAVAEARELADVGAHVRFNRDHAKADYGLAA